MQVVELDAASGGAFAWCEGELGSERRRERLNILWLGDVVPGEWVYAVLGQARERLTPERAEEIRRALEGVQAALAGETQLDAYFPDLTAKTVR
jgi:hypothetical protein